MSDRRIHLLHFMIEKKIEKLVPVPCIDSPIGYQVLETHDMLRVPIGQEFDVLNDLVDLGLFERELYDKVHLCPSCKHFALNFRETCPDCSSHLIDVVEMLHHYACGYLSYEDEFHKGTQLICPKCHNQLRHLGVDYERASANFRCHACTAVFPEAVTSCLSLACGESFPVEQAIIQKIYAYRLTERGILAASQESIYGEKDGMLAIDHGLELYTFQYFREQLVREIHRAARYGRPFSMLMMRPDCLGQYEEEGGTDAVRNVLKSLATWVKELSRDCDIVSIYQEQNFVLLLPETIEDHTIDIGERICSHVRESSLQQLGSIIHMVMGWSVFSADIESADQMIQLVWTKVQEEERLALGSSEPSV
ncbi:TackOD1 domain-containing metal-binding protein [Nitrospira sp. M1]